MKGIKVKPIHLWASHQAQYFADQTGEATSAWDCEGLIRFQVAEWPMQGTLIHTAAPRGEEE